MAGLVVALALPAPPHDDAPKLAEPAVELSGVPFDLYGDVIVTRDVVCAGDVGIVVERHIVAGVNEEGCSVEFFDMTRNTVALVTLAASALRLPTPADRPTVRAVSPYAVGAIMRRAGADQRLSTTAPAGSNW